MCYGEIERDPVVTSRRPDERLNPPAVLPVELVHSLVQAAELDSVHNDDVRRLSCFIMNTQEPPRTSPLQRCDHITCWIGIGHGHAVQMDPQHRVSNHRLRRSFKLLSSLEELLVEALEARVAPSRISVGIAASTR